MYWWQVTRGRWQGWVACVRRGGVCVGGTARAPMALGGSSMGATSCKWLCERQCCHNAPSSRPQRGRQKIFITHRCGRVSGLLTSPVSPPPQAGLAPPVSAQEVGWPQGFSLGWPSSHQLPGPVPEMATAPAAGNIAGSKLRPHVSAR